MSTTGTTLSGTHAIVAGASRGLGHGIATSLARAGAQVVGVSRTPASVADTETAGLAGSMQSEIADATDPAVAVKLLDHYDPDVLVLVAGATPHVATLEQQTWETFSLNWHTDVRIAFEWLRATLLRPLRPGSRVVVFSSGAALNPNGSPLSGGYAGAKATQRFIAGYAAEEAARHGLDIKFTSVMPQFAPQTDIGRTAVKAYAERAGMGVDEYLDQLPFAPLTPEIAGSAVVELVHADPASVAPAYILNGGGLKPLP